MTTTIEPRPTETAASPAGTVDRRVYRPSPVSIFPDSIYFYYVNPQRRPEITGYYFDNNGRITDIEGLIKQLAWNARDDLDMPPKLSANAKWRRKSYLAFLLDDPAQRFTPGQAVVFYDGSGAYKDNHAFFDGEDKSIDLSRTPGVTEVRTALVCINQMDRDDNGTDLGNGDIHTYQFRLNYGVPAIQLLPDSGGTNMGPPVPPPAFF